MSKMRVFSQVSCGSSSPLGVLARHDQEEYIQITDAGDTYCGTFGPEEIAGGLSEFVGYFMPYKVIEKRAKGYFLFREDNGRPIARLRPSSKGDLVKIMWWSYRDRWDQIGDFGPLMMPLEEALEYISKDPVGVFWG